MRIVFVRHGHPDYANDCLTELGRAHAKAAAERLKGEGICEIHASTRGRAMETALVTAEVLGLPVIPQDFMREISWGSEDGEEIFKNGHPWFTSDERVLRGLPVNVPDWQEDEWYRPNTKLLRCAQVVTDGLDEWMASLGYVREGAYYRVTGENTNRTVAMFSHGGSSTVALARLFNLPFPLLCSGLTPDFTAITIVTLSDDVGTLTMPRFEIANDARHIHASTETTYQ